MLLRAVISFLLLACATSSFANEVVYTLKECTVDGKPFYPLGIYAVGVADMPSVKSYGFNIVQVYGLGGKTDDEAKAYLDAAQANGLMVLFTLPQGSSPTTEENVALIKRRVEAFKDHPALFSWYLADEPTATREKPSDMAELYRWIKAADPHHPVMTSNWELHNFRDSTDMDMRQMYSGSPALNAKVEANYLKNVKKWNKDWVAIVNTYDSNWGTTKNREPRRFADITDPAQKEALMKEIAKKKEIEEVDDLPVDDFLGLSPAEFFRRVKPGSPAAAALKEREQNILANLANPPWPPLPAFPDSPLKIRSHALEVIAHGSNGMFYWLYQAEDKLAPRWGYYTVFLRPDLREALKNTMHELQSVSNRLAAPSVDSNTFNAGTDGKVFVWCRKQGARLTVIAVNESETEQEVDITLPFADLPKALLDHKDRRRVKLSAGVMHERFQPNEARLYIEHRPKQWAQ